MMKERVGEERGRRRRWKRENQKHIKKAETVLTESKNKCIEKRGRN
jgi:hypothetical protein